ncbi:MAG: response regulator [Pseudomonadota bacterium]
MLESKKLLLLEDEPIIAMLAEDLLSMLGAADVRRAATLAEAEQCCDQHAFDAALFDVDLQGDSSLMLAEQVQQEGVRVVLASGYSHLARDAADNFVVLAKPFTLPKLKAAFLEALDIADE